MGGQEKQVQGTTSGTAPSKPPRAMKSRKRKRKMIEEEPDEEANYFDFFKQLRISRIGGRQTTAEVLELYFEDLRTKICSGCEHGLKVVAMEGKGRGVVTQKIFYKDDFVVEYAGELISATQARQREELYEQEDHVGCYMYYFNHQKKRYCVDATKESGRLGRLLNHSRKSFNCRLKVVCIGDTPHLVVVASRQIERGEELTFDYGDDSVCSIMNHPWLKQ